MKHFAVAVDGPSGAGKSTVVKAISKDMGLRYVDTGATFRTVALKVIKSGLSTKSKEDVFSILDDLDIRVEFDNEEQINILDGEVVNGQIRTPEASMGSSDVSVFREVRLKLVEIWRQIASENNVIMDGRDIGTFVLPDAQVKIYLTADLDERANRRYKEMIEKGHIVTLEEVKKSIEERDFQDANRAFSPAVKAEDAILLDTTDMSIDQVIEEIKSIITRASRGDNIEY